MENKPSQAQRKGKHDTAGCWGHLPTDEQTSHSIERAKRFTGNSSGMYILGDAYILSVDTRILLVFARYRGRE